MDDIYYYYYRHNVYTIGSYHRMSKLDSINREKKKATQNK